MRKFGLILFLLFAPVLILAVGCGEPYRKQFGPDFGGDMSAAGAGQAPTEELKSDGWATLEGQITFAGDLPENDKLAITKDQNVCECAEAVMRGETRLQTWIGMKTDKGYGLANVVVFLRPPSGKHFNIHDKYKNVAGDEKLKEVVLDQPFCAYDPHLVILYPSYSTGTKQEPSGQVFTIKNSAGVNHNTKIAGAVNSYVSRTLVANGDAVKDVKLEPENGPLNVSCDIHPWMRGIVWCLDHPYAARTDKDGKFKIENVPAGAEVNVVIWHEGIGYHSGDGFEGKTGKKITFTNGESAKLNLSVTKK
jgi:hypothetical protein